jgi:hypothetical protein
MDLGKWENFGKNKKGFEKNKKGLRRIKKVWEE